MVVVPGLGLALARRGPYIMSMLRIAEHFEFTAPTALVADLVRWVADRPRTYRETMDAWRTSCPRLPVWEDAMQAGFLAVERDDARQLVVVTTPEGLAFVQGRAPRT